MTDFNLKVLYWNFRSIYKRKCELEKIVLDYDIVVGVETWATGDITFPNYTVYQLNRERGRGGGLIFIVKSNIEFEKLQFETLDERVEFGAIGIKMKDYSIKLVLCYKPPDVHMTEEFWIDTMQNKIIADGACILVGDFNSHHNSWNCEKSDKDGEVLLTAIDASGLLIQNSDTLTHIDVARNKKSNLDLIISSFDVSGLIDYQVFDETLGSDHFPLEFIISMEKHIHRQKSFKLHSVKTDWNQVYENLSKSSPRLMEASYLLGSGVEKYEMWIEIVTDAVKKSTPVKRNLPASVHRNPVPWWDEDCDRLKRLRRAAFKKWEYSGRQEDYDKYTAACKKLIREFKKKKRKDFKKFASTIDFRKNHAYVWKKTKIFKNKWVKTKGNFQDKKEHEKLVKQALESMAPYHNPQDDLKVEQTFSGVKLPLFEQHFDFLDLNVAIESRKKHSSSGVDGVDYLILSKLPVKFKLDLLDIYNQMHDEKKFPEAWKKTYVHFIPKSDGKGVRPIAMTSCLSKIYEIMLKSRLQWFCERNEIFPLEQSGFRKARSTMDNLTSLTLYVEDGFKKGKDTLAAFLDVKGAFPGVKPHLLLEKLRKVGVSDVVLEYVRHTTAERYIYSQYNLKEPRFSYQGLPQGGVLSPLLYLIYVSEVNKGLPRSLQISHFADDIAVYTNRKPLKSSKKILEEGIETIRSNLAELELELSIPKTQLIHFKKKQNEDNGDEQVSITVQGIVVPSTQNARFLGLVFDASLSFEAQVKKVVNKCQKAHRIMKYICGTWWGAHPETLLRLYKSFVRSVMDYGIYLYYPKTKALAERLEKMQFRALRTAMGYRISTAKNVILEETKLLSIKDRAFFLGCSYITKALSNQSNSSNARIGKYYNEHKKSKLKRRRIIEVSIGKVMEVTQNKKILQIRNKGGIYDLPHDIFVKPPSVNLDFGRVLLNADDPGLLLDLVFFEQDGVHKYFTDGSLSEGSISVGAACYFETLGLVDVKSLNPAASVFTAEAQALNLALDVAKQSPGKRHVIFSDARSVLQACMSSKMGSVVNPMVLDARRKMYEIQRNTQVSDPLQLVWIPSHKGIIGNEIADKLAKRTTLEVPSDTPIPYTDFKKYWKNLAWENSRMNCQQKAQQAKPTGVKYFEKFKTESKSPWFKGKNLDRKTIVTVNRLRANHYSAAASLYRKNLVEGPECQCGDESQDANHLIWKCPLYEGQRIKMEENFKKCKINVKRDIDDIVMNLSLKTITIIIDFLESCGLNL